MSNINPVEATNTAELHPQGFSRMKPTADLIGVSVQSIKRWYNAGKFVKPVNVNGVLLFKNSDLIAWVEQQHSDSEVNHEK